MLLLAIFGLLAGLVYAIPTISVKGSKFFTSDGNQFFLKGVHENCYRVRILTDLKQASLTSSSLTTHSSTTTNANATRT